jgi:phosphoribosylformylglycinamidine cyclo-ligase
VSADTAVAAIAALEAEGIATWQVGTVHDTPLPTGGVAFEQGAKGVDGGAVRLVGAYGNGGAGIGSASQTSGN